MTAASSPNSTAARAGTAWHGRSSTASAANHGQRYREGQEDQLGALGLVVNAVVLWNTRYLDPALSQVRAFDVFAKPEDVERISSLLLDHVNVLNRYEFALKESVRQGQLRPLHIPDERDDRPAATPRAAFLRV